MLIIRNDVRPESNIYYIGAKFLDYFRQCKEIEMHDFFNLAYADFSSISINQIIYTLDWLYILNKIDLIDEGLIIRCD
ncbi:hypothetical protein IE3_03220 [Bacillus cereus BAG3X2-1]|nr:hypothetical protein IE3_03220 [Bacillus cereus BAG3X2-1]